MARPKATCCWWAGARPRDPIREAVDRARAAGDSVSALHIKHLNPLPPGLENIFSGFNHIRVVEMNDEGLYGYGQLAGLLRARYCDAEDPRHQQDRRPDLEGAGNPRTRPGRHRRRPVQTTNSNAQLRY